jgi:hypothetical protein
MHKSFAPERRSAEGQPPLSRRRWQIGLLLAACLGMSLMLSGGSVRAAPTVTTLTVNNPTCAQLQVATNACVIKIRSISASSTDPLFSHVEISVNGKLRAHLSAFFEQNIYPELGHAGRRASGVLRPAWRLRGCCLWQPVLGGDLSSYHRQSAHRRRG